MQEPQIDQVTVKDDERADPPKVIWRTAWGRAHLGFWAETHQNPAFYNDDYLAALAGVEIELTKRLTRMIAGSFLFSVFSIASATSTLGEASFQGFRIASTPYLTEFCVLILGVLFTSLIIVFLDLFTISRMRFEIFSVTGSEVPNMRMLHLKRSTAVFDIFLPKHKGYSSGAAHKTVQMIGLIWSIMLPVAVLSVLIVAQLIAAQGFFVNFEWDLGTGITIVGLGWTAFSLVVIVLVTMVPIRFKWREQSR